MEDLKTKEKRAVLLAKKAAYRLRVGHTPRFKTLSESLFARVNKTDACWLFTGVPQATGYGHVVFKGKTYKAHRLAWELLRGPVPAGMVVCHICDVRLCVNPDHLFVGTVADNNADRDAKGRHRTNPRRGTDAPSAKLNPVTAGWIRELRSKGFTQKAIARVFGVSQGLVNLVQQGKRWTT